MKSIEQMAWEAEQLGMSYGQYVALCESEGGAQRVNIYFKQLLDTWEDLLAALDALTLDDPETAAKFKGAIRDSVSEFPAAIDEMEGA